MAWKEQMTGDLVMVKKKQWINHDIAKFHAVFTRQNGAVETTQDGTITRQNRQAALVSSIRVDHRFSLDASGHPG